MSDPTDVSDAAKAPNLDGLAKLLVEAMYDPTKLKRLELAIGNAHAYGATAAAGAQHAAAQDVLAGLGANGSDMVAKVRGWTSYLLAHMTGHLLGVEVPESAFRKTARDGDSVVGRALGETFLEVLRGPGGELAPGDEGAIRLIGALTQFALNAWFEGTIIEEAASVIPFVGHAEEIGKLGQSLVSATGLDELGRLAFRPLGMITVAQPMEWQANQRYRPTQVSPAAAVRHWFRGFWTYDQMYEVLTRAGYSDAAIEALQYDARKYFSVADVYLLQRFGLWTEAEALQHLRESGLEADQALIELQLADAKNLRTFQRQSSEVAITAYASGAIGQGQLDAELAGSITDPIERDRLRFLAQKRRDLEVKDLSLGQAEQAVELEVWSITDYRAYLDRHNYGHDAALTLELMLLAKLKRAGDLAKARAQAAAERAAAKAFARQELEAKRAQLAAEHADFSGTIAQAERLVVRGQVDPGRYRRVLIDHGYTSDDASDLMTLAQQDATEYAATLERRRQAIAKAAQQQLAVATLERAVKAGRLSLEDYRRELLARNFTDAQAQLLVDVLAADVAHQQAAEATRAAAAAKLAVKHLSLGQEELAVRRGLQTVDAYRAFLAGAGFSSADQTTLIALLQTTLANDARAEQLRARAAAKLEASHLSLAEEEKAVAQQLKTLDDYAAFLQAHDFTVDDVQTLVALLALKLGLS